MTEGETAKEEGRLGAGLDLSCANRRDAPLTLPELVAVQCMLKPDSLAVSAREGRQTYAELDLASRRWAQALTKAGLGRGDRVLVCLERGFELPSVLLGVLRCGATYVPVDPRFPRDRVAVIAADSGASGAIVSRKTRPLIPESGLVFLESDAMGAAQEIMPDAARGEACATMIPKPVPIDAESLAYLIFTSGSTGRPKGVPITHRALLNFLLAMAERPGIHAGDRVLALTTVSFDISVLELFLPLIVGASVYVASSEETLDPGQLADFIESNQLTLLQATPATWQLLIEHGWRPSKRQTILCGGEAFPLNLAQMLYRHAGAVWNMYGPTEATVWASVRRIEDADIRRGRIPLGAPLPGMAYRIEPVPVRPADPATAERPRSQRGELLIAGVGVTPGYFGRPELDRDRFVLRNEEGRVVRYYRTGDLVERDDEGCIFYLDRLDNQVKLRGYRVELGEIETALAELDPVLEAAVVLARPGPGDPVLVGCVRLKEPCPDARLEEHLQARLPEYMVPHVWARFAQLPQTPNRKIDRKALKEEIERSPRGAGVPADFEMPWQKELAELWSELLGQGPEQETDDFLALGGHSLLAARLSALIDVRLKRKVRAVDLLTGSTLQQQAQHVASAATTEETSSATPLSRTPLSAAPLSATQLPGSLGLSPAQQQMWFAGELYGDHRVYHESEAYRITGPLDIERLQQALDRVIGRHAALQLQLGVDADGHPVWSRQPDIKANFQVVELARQEIQSQTLAAALSREAARAFRLTEEPLIRFCLFTDGTAEHVLQCTAHHMIIDGLSQTRLWQELTREYREDQGEDSSSSASVDARFLHYLAQNPSYTETDLDFWRAEFETVPPSLELVVDKPRPGRFDFTAHQVTADCRPGTRERLQEMVRELRTTPFVLLLGLYSAFLERYARQGEYVIGTAVNGRAAEAASDAVGLFINTLPLRLRVEQGETLESLVRRVQTVAFRGFAHDQVPFGQIVAAVNPPRDASRTPLYQTLFGLNELTARPSELTAECPWRPEPVDTGFAPTELVLLVDIDQEQLRLRLQGSQQLFSPDTLQRMACHFQLFLENAIASREQPHDRIPWLASTEESLFEQWNRTAAEYPSKSSIAACFRDQVERAPDAIALEQGSTKVSYAALARYAAGIAADLVETGVNRGDRVGLAVGRSIEAVGAMLGILEIGAVYVPLDLGYPSARLRIMLDESQVDQVLVRPRDRQRLSTVASHASSIALRDFDAGVSGATYTGQEPGADSPAYIMFTSGSTGMPKGIEVSHRNVLRLVKNTNFMELGPQTRFMMYAPLSFDASNVEIWGPLLNGGSLVVPEMANPSGEDLQQLIVANKVNSVWLTTALFHHMAEHHAAAFAETRYLLTGGELLSAKWARHVLQANPGLTLINFYGPTENTTFSSYYPMRDLAAVTEPVPIGRPIANSTLHVLDPGGQPCPIDVPGELWVGGEGVARGYVGQPELSRRVFVADPFTERKGGRMYRTGDRVRWRADGNLEFLGRLDRQVKIRGHRIEPDEVTTVLERCPGVSRAITVPWDAPSGERQLISYVTSGDAGGALDTQELRRQLADALPNYMLPAQIVPLSVFPVGPTGKIDQGRLPEPDVGVQDGRLTEDRPLTPTEHTLKRIWQDVLRVDQVRLQDNFFALGGSSIKALAVFTQIEQALGLNVPLVVLLTAPTLAELAIELETRRSQPAEPQAETTFRQAWQSLVVLKPQGHLPPLVCIHAVGGNILCYRGLLDVADPDRPILAFQSQGLDGLRAPQLSIRQMAEDYVGELMASGYRGPYILLGGSMGGTVALEMAAVLETMGEQVEWVILLDSVGPEGRIIPPEKPTIQFRERFWRSIRARTAYYLKSTLTWAYRQSHLRLPYWLRPFFIEQQHKSVLANHRERPYWGKVLLLRGPERFRGVYSDPSLGWSGTLKGEILIEEVDAPHADFIESVQTQSKLKIFFEQHCWSLCGPAEDHSGQITADHG